MRYLQLYSSLILLCAQNLDTSYAFESNTRRIFALPRWGRTALPAAPAEPSQQSDEIYQSDRRKLILSSAAALASAVLGRPQQSEASTTLILEESEQRRIDIFEKCAPSVVFIDTFAEKQDVFSPNSIEIPIGSGSGFVWDKEGHIGKSL
jgi:S1-C subfamily serine protease